MKILDTDSKYMKTEMLQYRQKRKEGITISHSVKISSFVQIFLLGG